jgi:hypothetical protein
MAYDSASSTSLTIGEYQGGEWAVQNGWTMQADGFGLIQLSLDFVADQSIGDKVTKVFERGTTLSQAGVTNLAAYDACTVVKCSMTKLPGEWVKASVQYAGIDPAYGNETTLTQVTISSSSVSEPIQSHPNFTKVQVPQIGNMILGGNHPPPIEINDPENPFRAKWIPSKTGMTTSYQFVDFLPTQISSQPVNRKAGVKNYFRPSITMKMLCYTTNGALAKEAAQKVGWITGGNFGPFSLPAPYDEIPDDGLDFVQTDGQKAYQKNWMVTGVNVEVFGALYKCQADLMLSGVAGWDSDIYPYNQDATAG